MKTSRKNRENIIIFIDNSNLFHSFRKINFMCDYKKLKNILTGDRNLVNAILYMGLMYPVKAKDKAWLNKLKYLGYKVKTRSVKVSPTGIKKEKRIDVLMAVDMIASAFEISYDTILLVSGDSDFIPVIVKLLELGKNVEIWSFKDLLSSQLKEVAGLNNCHYIDDILDELAF
ncbi:MAG: NYN domain-containing protein [Candidatus Lokiarchaeota archaeon]|nr:NYN domain-containing protein [Candidatus Lokiarchaeota archaeon]